MAEIAPNTSTGANDAVSWREIGGRGVATFAARSFAIGEVILQEAAVSVSALAVSGVSMELYGALKSDERARRAPSCDPLVHLGALVALHTLGPAGCRTSLLGLCCGEDLPADAYTVKRDAAPLRSMIKQGLLPQTASSFSAREYAQLVRVVSLNGFRYNEGLNEDDPNYDVGEALFPQIARINHKCAPNAEFTLSWSHEHGSVVNSITALRPIEDGEEINFSYLPILLRLSFAERQKQLSKHWGFTCDCCRCIEEGDCAAMASDGVADCGACSDDEANNCIASSPILQDASENCRLGSNDHPNDLCGAEKSPRSDASSVGMCWDDLHDPDSS